MQVPKPLGSEETKVPAPYLLSFETILKTRALPPESARSGFKEMRKDARYVSQAPSPAETGLGGNTVWGCIHPPTLPKFCKAA